MISPTSLSWPTRTSSYMAAPCMFSAITTAVATQVHTRHLAIVRGDQDTSTQVQLEDVASAASLSKIAWSCTSARARDDQVRERRTWTGDLVDVSIVGLFLVVAEHVRHGRSLLCVAAIFLCSSRFQARFLLELPSPLLRVATATTTRSLCEEGRSIVKIKRRSDCDERRVHLRLYV